MSKPAENHLKTGGESLDFQNKLEVTNRISDSCYDTFQALKLRRKHKYIIYKIGDEEIDVEKTGERKSVSLVSVCCKNVLYCDGICNSRRTMSSKLHCPTRSADSVYMTRITSRQTVSRVIVVLPAVSWYWSRDNCCALQGGKLPSYGSSAGFPTTARRTIRWHTRPLKRSFGKASLACSTHRYLRWRS
jgi:hypothetical protein